MNGVREYDYIDLEVLAASIRDRANRVSIDSDTAYLRHQFADLLGRCAVAARALDLVDAGKKPEGHELWPIQWAMGLRVKEES